MRASVWEGMSAALGRPSKLGIGFVTDKLYVHHGLMVICLQSVYPVSACLCNLLGRDRPIGSRMSLLGYVGQELVNIEDLKV